VTWREEDEIYNFLVILSSVSRHPQLLSERFSFWNTAAGTLPKRRKSNQQQSGTAKQFPSRCNQLIYRNKKKPLIFRLKPSGEIFSESRGKQKGIPKDS